MIVGAGMFSLRVIVRFAAGGFPGYYPLGMTGGQVRQLGTRVTRYWRMSGVSSSDDWRVSRKTTCSLLSRIRDYQDVLEIAQQSNISLSKRLA